MFTMVLMWNCCVPLCTNNWRNSPKLKTHSLPSEEGIRKEYARLIRNDNLLSDSSSTRIQYVASTSLAVKELPEINCHRYFLGQSTSPLEEKLRGMFCCLLHQGKGKSSEMLQTTPLLKQPKPKAKSKHRIKSIQRLPLKSLQQ